MYVFGFPSGASGEEPICQCRKCKRLGFHPWAGKILWQRAWQSTPVHGVTKSWTRLKQLMHPHICITESIRCVEEINTILQINYILQ